jgi:hypothetical protein
MVTGNSGFDGSLDGCNQRAFVRGGDREGIDTARDHRIDDLDLPCVIGFVVGSVP